MGQHSKDCFAARALNAPDGETAQAHARIMRMASQTTAAVTGRFVCKLKTQREDESQDKLDECFAIAEQREVGSFIVEIDGNGAVLSGRFGGVGHVASPCGWQSVWMRYGERNVSKHQGVAGARGRYHLIRWNLGGRAEAPACRNRRRAGCSAPRSCGPRFPRRTLLCLPIVQLPP